HCLRSACQPIPTNVKQQLGFSNKSVGCDIIADKGFISASWLDELARGTGNRVWTAHRANQHQQHSGQFNRFISRIRQRVEGVFHEIGEYWTQPMNVLLNKTVAGLCAHIAAKMASHTLRLLLRRRFGIDVLTFTFAASSSMLPVQPS
ncbi:MAG: hypothetical protein F6K26_56590, partial [Moorea sp. SIO2I5]|nr:hypothetical protein [Moorena sp. SIO2I5]